MNKIKTIFEYLVVATLLTVPLVSFAQINLPTGTALTLDELEDLIIGIANFLLAISIAVAVIFIVWGGIRFVSAQNDPNKVKAARSTIINGLIGALIILGFGVLLNTLAGVVSRAFFGTYGL